MTVRQALEAGKDLLTLAGIEEAALDARLLLEHVTGLSRSALLLSWAQELPEEQLEAFKTLLARRALREPLQHIVGSVSFMGIDIACDRRALIPRQETELLAEQAIEYSKAVEKDGLTVLDLCTGTGCIAISLALLGRYSAVTATDISEEALTLARENITRNKASVELLQGDLFAAVEDRRFDVIVSNPPYIAAVELKTLMPEVQEHDPLLALDGGADGLKFYRRIAAEAPQHLKPGGRLYLEIGAGQGEEVSTLLAENGFADIRILQDYSGRDRIVSAAEESHV